MLCTVVNDSVTGDRGSSSGEVEIYLDKKKLKFWVFINYYKVVITIPTVLMYTFVDVRYIGSSISDLRWI